MINFLNFFKKDKEVKDQKESGYKDYYYFIPSEGKAYEFTGKIIYNITYDDQNITIYKTNSDKIISIIDNLSFYKGPYIRICNNIQKFNDNPKYLLFWAKDNSFKDILNDLYKKRIIEPIIIKID